MSEPEVRWFGSRGSSLGFCGYDKIRTWFGWLQRGMSKIWMVWWGGLIFVGPTGPWASVHLILLSTNRCPYIDWCLYLCYLNLKCIVIFFFISHCHCYPLYAINHVERFQRGGSSSGIFYIHNARVLNHAYELKSLTIWGDDRWWNALWYVKREMMEVPVVVCGSCTASKPLGHHHHINILLVKIWLSCHVNIPLSYTSIVHSCLLFIVSLYMSFVIGWTMKDG